MGVYKLILFHYLEQELLEMSHVYSTRFLFTLNLNFHSLKIEILVTSIFLLRKPEIVLF